MNAFPLEFESLPPAWALGLVLLPGLALLAGWAYRVRRERSPRILLAAGLRFFLLLFVLYLGFGPYLRHVETRVEPAGLALLADDSASMLATDPPREGTRLERLRALLGSPWAETLAERYALDGWKFAGDLDATAHDGSGLRGRGDATALGDSLLALLDEYRGRRMPNVVVLSDGRGNLGADAAVAAEAYRSAGVTVHAVGFGRADDTPDLVLERVQAPDQLIAGDVGLFTLRLRGSGDGLPERVRVVLEDEEGVVLDETEVEGVDANGQTFTLSARLEEEGQRRLVARAEPAPRERILANNELALPLEVRRVVVRVLYVEGRPRWEYSYLQRRLIRAEKDVALQCWLAEATPGFIQEHSRSVPPLTRLPTTADELLAAYDVVVLGDVEPSRMTSDPLDGPRFLEAVADFVEHGGGLLLVAGPRANPRAFAGSPIEPLLPVVIGRETPLGADRPFRAVPPDPSLPHPVVRLEPDLERNRDWWTHATELHWFFPVERLRPGATAWLVHDALENAFGPYVIAASTYAPEGWVGWLGTDETWRWRFPDGERYLERFWRGALRHLAATRLRGDQGRARLDVDRSRLEVGEYLQVEARLLDDAYQPVVEESVQVWLLEPGRAVRLDAVPGEPGRYRGRLRATDPGSFLLVLPPPGGGPEDALASARFEVVLPSRETRDVSPDHDALRLLAERTGGRFVSEADADALLATLDGSERHVREVASRREALDPRWLLALLLLLASGEWLVRKTLDLA